MRYSSLHFIFSRFLPLCSGLVLALLSETAAFGADAEDRIPLSDFARFKKPEMVQIGFSHDRHIEALTEEITDCLRCHMPVEPGSEELSYGFLESSAVLDDSLQTYYHEQCVQCHVRRASEKKNTGPRIAECRSCHIQAAGE